MRVRKAEILLLEYMKFTLFKCAKRSCSRLFSPDSDKFTMRGRKASPRFSLDPHVDRTLRTWEDINEYGLYLVHAVNL